MSIQPNKIIQFFFEQVTSGFPTWGELSFKKMLLTKIIKTNKLF